MTLLGSGGSASMPPGAPIDPHSVTGRVAHSAQTVILSDYVHAVGTDFQELARMTGGESAVAVPVFVGGELWGSLGVLLHERSVPAAAVELLERLAQLISAAIANTYAQARLREEARLEGALREVAAASAGGECDADASSRSSLHASQHCSTPTPRWSSASTARAASARLHRSRGDTERTGARALGCREPCDQHWTSSASG